MSKFNLTFGLLLSIVPYSSTMFLIIFKFSYVSVAISHLLCSFTFNFPINKVTFIPGLIGPNHDTIFIIHLIILKFTIIHSTSVGKIIFSSTVKLAIYKVSNIITPFTFNIVSSLSSLSSVDKISFINFVAIVPFKFTLSVLLIVFPST